VRALFAQGTTNGIIQYSNKVSVADGAWRHHTASQNSPLTFRLKAQSLKTGKSGLIAQMIHLQVQVNLVSLSLDINHENAQNRVRVYHWIFVLNCGKITYQVSSA
jgi:hypothetical protein